MEGYIGACIYTVIRLFINYSHHKTCQALWRPHTHAILPLFHRNYVAKMRPDRANWPPLAARLEASKHGTGSSHPQSQVSDSTHGHVSAWYTCHSEEKSSEVLLSSVRTGGILTHVGSDYWVIANVFWSKKMSPHSYFGRTEKVSLYSGYSGCTQKQWYQDECGAKFVFFWHVTWLSL